MNTFPVPCPPPNRTGCEPEFPSPPTQTTYYLRNRKRPNTNFILAGITRLGYFHYNVENTPDDGLGCPGSWLFELAGTYFEQLGVAVQGIRGDWTFGTNLATINRLTSGGQMTVEDAATDPSLWAFQRARRKEYARVEVLDINGAPGQYIAVDVVYKQ